MKKRQIASGKVIQVRITNALKDMAMSNCKAWPNNYNFVKILNKFKNDYKPVWNLFDSLIMPENEEIEEEKTVMINEKFDIKNKIKFVTNDSLKFIFSLKGLKNFIPVDVKSINMKYMMELKLN